MLQGKTLIIVLIALVIGFAGGFVLRPIIIPAQQSVADANAAPIAPTSTDARGTQYFLVHIDEARQVVTGCCNGSVRGSECTTAEEAIIKADAQERRKRFLSN